MRKTWNFEIMVKKNFKNYLLYFLIVILIFISDRLSKLYIVNIYDNFGQVDLSINNYLDIILIWNKGIGFGLFSFDSSMIYNIITFLIVTINIVILYFGIVSDKIRSFLFFIILGGSLGNLFDRVYYSAVPDFIDLHYEQFHWFIFNVADIFITLGIISLIILEFKDYVLNKTNE